MQWRWDRTKNRANFRKHGLDFETAVHVFNDPLAVSRLDRSASEERWQTVGMIGHTIVFVVHTWPELDVDGGVETSRIISARRASAHERRAYEEGKF